MKSLRAFSGLARHRLVAETVWVFVGQVFGALGALVGIRLVTEVVPPAVFGGVALTMGVIALAQGLAAGPLLQGMLRLYPECLSSGNSGELRAAVLGALRLPVSAALVALLVGLTAWEWGTNGSLWLGVLAALLFVTEVARSVEITELNAARRQKAMAILSVADAWMRPALAVLAVWLSGASTSVVVAGYLAGALAPLLVFYLHRGLFAGRGRVAGATSLQARLWRYAKPLVLLPIINWVSGQADRYMLAALAGLPAAGAYAALYGLASKPFLMLAAGSELAFRQVYYGHVSAGHRDAERRSFRLWLFGVIVASVVMAGLLSVFHRDLAWWLLAAEYRQHSEIVFWIAGGYVFFAASQVVERICYALHDTRGVAWVQTAGAVLSIAVGLPMIASFGLQGAAWSVPIYFGLQLLVAICRARWALAARERETGATWSADIARSPHA